MYEENKHSIVCRLDEGKFVGNQTFFPVFNIVCCQKASIVLYVMLAWLVSRHVDLISHILANWVIYIFQQ